MTNTKTQTRIEPKSDAKSERAKIIRERIAALQLRMLDGLDAILDKTAAVNIPSPSLSAARRLVANQFRLYLYCDRSICRRSGCCRGEPRDCLRIGLPLLPPDAIADIVRRDEGRAKRRPLHSGRAMAGR